MDYFGDKKISEKYYNRFNFNKDLELMGETIESAAVTAVDSDGHDATNTILDSGKQIVSSPYVYFWNKNGAAQEYVLTCVIVTELGSCFKLEGILPVIND